MPRLLQGFFGEKSLTKFAVYANDAAQASAIGQAVAHGAQLDPSQIRILDPSMARRAARELFARSVEPEQAGVWRTLWRAHLIAGAIGAAAGFAVHRAFIAADTPAVASSPYLTLAVMMGFGTAFGLMVGGLIALRPDHFVFIRQLRASLEDGQWAVVVHPVTVPQTQAVAHVVKALNRPHARTL